MVFEVYIWSSSETPIPIGKSACDNCIFNHNAAIGHGTWDTLTYVAGLPSKRRSAVGLGTG